MSTKDSIVKNVAWRFVERVLSQIITVVVSVVLARLLLPEDYGAISMVTIFIALAEALISNGLPAALIQKKNADDEDFSSVFYANIIISLILYMVLFLAAPWISSFFGIQILSPVLRVIGVVIIISALRSVQYAYISKHMLFKKFFWCTLAGSIFSGVAGIIVAFLNGGVWALVVQQLVSAVVNTIATAIIIPWYPKRFFSMKKIKLLFSYGWKILVEGISETLTNQARSLIIGKVYTSEDLGYYSKAQQFPNLLVNSIVVSISSVLFPTMSNIQDDTDAVKALMRNSVKITTYVMFPLILGLALVGEPFIRVVLTDRWLGCVPYLQIFCFTQATTVGMICRHEALKSIGRSDVYMYEHIIYRVVVFAILLAVYKISVIAIAMSLIAGSIIMSVTVGVTSKKYNGYTFKEQLMDVLPTTLVCILMGIPVYFIGFLQFSSIVVLALQIVSGGIVYIALSHIFKIESYAYIVNMLKRFLRS